MAQVSLVERHVGVVDLAVRTRPGVESYLFGAAVSLDTAQAGVATMFTVPRNASFRSPSLQRSGVNYVDESNRGLTRVQYAPADYATASIPGDSTLSFVRVVEINSAGASLLAGPILVVPPPGFFVAGRSPLALNGTAPNIAGLSNNQPPQTAMWIDFPKFVADLVIYNDGGSSLALSFGPGTQEILILNGTSLALKDLGTSLISVRGSGGTAAFRLVASLVNGLMA